MFEMIDWKNMSNDEKREFLSKFLDVNKMIWFFIIVFIIATLIYGGLK